LLPPPKPKFRGKDLLIIAAEPAIAAHVSCVRYLIGAGAGGSTQTLECATEMSLLKEFKLCKELPTDIVLSVLENSLQPEPVFSLKSTAIVLKADAGVV